MAEVLIAGGAGFIGSHLVDRVLRRYDVSKLVVVDNLWTGRLQNLAHVHDERLRIVTCRIEDFITEDKFDEIMHLASPASPNWYMADPIRTISANLVGAMRLKDLLMKGGRLSFTSTSEVYGDPQVSPQPENYRGSVDCTGPRSSYDESKRCTEALLFECQRMYGMDIRVVRLFNVYGPRMQPEDGRAISNFLTQAIRGAALTVYGDGLQTRSWGYVDDITEALERLFWRDKIEYVGPINIGNDREITVLDTAKFVASLVPGAQIEFKPAAPQDPTNRRPDLTVAKSLLPGWNPIISYEEGVKMTLNWYRDQLNY